MGSSGVVNSSKIGIPQAVGTVVILYLSAILVHYVSAKDHFGPDCVDCWDISMLAVVYVLLLDGWNERVGTYGHRNGRHTEASILQV